MTGTTLINATRGMTGNLISTLTNATRGMTGTTLINAKREMTGTTLINAKREMTGNLISTLTNATRGRDRTADTASKAGSIFQDSGGRGYRTSGVRGRRDGAYLRHHKRFRRNRRVRAGGIQSRPLQASGLTLRALTGVGKPICIHDSDNAQHACHRFRQRTCLSSIRTTRMFVIDSDNARACHRFRQCACLSSIQTMRMLVIDSDNAHACHSERSEESKIHDHKTDSRR